MGRGEQKEKKTLKRGWDVGVYKKVGFHDRSYVISTLTRLQTSSRLHFSDLIYAEEDQSQPFLKIKEEAKIKKKNTKYTKNWKYRKKNLKKKKENKSHGSF